ncbi:class I adenylate-forming enzyme family protein [Baekduia alba]|uniref:class I adenylate-forming enzyme family protein n=1 Tax=Baekduia alba TaxID=2997333 RepID=UPI0032C48635
MLVRLRYTKPRTRENAAVLTLGEVLERNARRHADRVAIIDETTSRTHRELATRAWGLAEGLRREGVGAGDRVGVLAQNGAFGAECVMAAAAIGAIAVMYNWRWATPELVFALNQSRPAVVLVDGHHRADLDAALATGDVGPTFAVVDERSDYASLLVAGAGPPALAVDPSAPAVMLYTGGTTGFPKGVLLSHANVMANAFNEIVDTDMRDDDRTLCIAPMFHSASLLCWFMPHMVLGASAVLVRSFDEREVARTIADTGVTNGFLVPNMVRRMLHAGALEDCASTRLRRIYVGGAAFLMEDKRAVAAAVPGVSLYYQYGLTEAGPIVTRLRPEDMFRPELDGSIGREFLLCSVEVREPDGTPSPAGEPGEIHVKGPNVMLGYFEDPDATADVLSDGWLRTGDVAARDAEGYLFFRDRTKDMIKTGGENVHSAEVEHVLYTHPAVAEAAVLGVPSTAWDEEVCAVVAVKPGADVTIDALREHCRAQLAGYKVPKRMVLVGLDDMPISQTGKVLKRDLAERQLFA